MAVRRPTQRAELLGHGGDGIETCTATPMNANDVAREEAALALVCWCVWSVGCVHGAGLGMTPDARRGNSWNENTKSSLRSSMKAPFDFIRCHNAFAANLKNSSGSCVLHSWAFRWSDAAIATLAGCLPVPMMPLTTHPQHRIASFMTSGRFGVMWVRGIVLLRFFCCAVAPPSRF